MTSFWNSKLARRNIDQRFDAAAVLWLIKSEGELAGYGWTLQGGTMEPYYFPLGTQDVHLFDFHVFPRYRGRGMNPLLVRHILRRLAAEGLGRAFIEAAEWNRAQLSSLGKTPFRRFGSARKWTALRRTVVFWANGDTVDPMNTGSPWRSPSQRLNQGISDILR
jgi:ribosomal protein S18 acetylase RimI-like enzyme